MSRGVLVPRPLHDVLGRTQTPAELALVVLAATAFSAAICSSGAAAFAAVPPWRAVLAGLLVVDIAAGCVANFTTGTDLHYAQRPTSRWVFVLVHWHLVLVGVLLDVALVPLLLVTAYALLAAAGVNLLREHPLHVTLGGCLAAGGIVGLVLWRPAGTPPFVVATAALFVVKVVLAFAVTHHEAPVRTSDSSGAR